jgi:hypothetical protein
MRIISKYKDFYDYTWIDNDPDLIYVRKEKVCFSMPNIESSYNQHLGEGVKTYWVSGGGYVDIVGYTFGIYPYVYTVPAMSVSTCSYSYMLKLLTKDDMEFLSILKTKKEIHEFFETICNTMFTNHDNKPDIILSYPIDHRPYQEAMRFCWKKEDPELFLKLDAPVFVLYDNDVLGQTYKHLDNVTYDQKHISQIQIIKNEPIYKDPYSGKVTPKLITNVCFNKLALPVYKYWFDEMHDVYSDIENFLMTSRLDPEPIISNNGKIIAHGFDLKTSFRKM